MSPAHGVSGISLLAALDGISWIMGMFLYGAGITCMSPSRSVPSAKQDATLGLPNRWGRTRCGTASPHTIAAPGPLRVRGDDEAVHARVAAMIRTSNCS